MADAKKIQINGVWYDVKDETARNGLSSKANLASPTFTGTPKAPTATAGTNTTQIATTAFVQDAVSGIGGGSDILYFANQAVSAATSAELFRITNTNITTNTIVLECTFADPSKISGKVNWTSYAGYIAFTGTCTAATTANVTLAEKCN